MSTRPRVAIYCQYVYGIGHYVRAVELARGLSEQFDVVVLNGGEVIPGYDLPAQVSCLQLPALFKQEGSDTLVSVDPSLDVDSCWRVRASLLERFVARTPPDVLVTEHFPFGQLFEKEAMGLVAHVRNRRPAARIVCSVRDIVESEGGGSRDDHVRSVLNRWYDAVLVHADENLVPFSASFPLVEKIATPLHYTGYIVDPVVPRVPRPDRPLLLASIGGGRLGEELLYAVLEAHQELERRWPHELLLFTGAFQRNVERLHKRLASLGSSHATVQAFNRNSYRRMLALASGLVCLGGYNSLLEAISARVPVMAYTRPFDRNNREQVLRATAFQRHGLIRCLPPQALSPDRLVPRLEIFQEDARNRHVVLMTHGAERSRQLLDELVHHGA